MIGSIRLAGPLTAGSRSRGRSADRIGDAVLYGLCLLAALLAVVSPSWRSPTRSSTARAPPSRTSASASSAHATWQPNPPFEVVRRRHVHVRHRHHLGDRDAAVGSARDLDRGLYLSMVAPRRVRGVIGPLVEMLAAIPSVILGFWGILVFGPFLQAHVEPFLHSVLGFLPIFGAPRRPARACSSPA